MKIKDVITQLENLHAHCKSMENSDYEIWNDDVKALKIAIAVLSEIDRFVPGYMPGKDVKSCGQELEKS